MIFTILVCPLYQGRIQDEAKETSASFKKRNIPLKEYRSQTIIIQQIYTP